MSSRLLSDEGSRAISSNKVQSRIYIQFQDDNKADQLVMGNVLYPTACSQAQPPHWVTDIGYMRR